MSMINRGKIRIAEKLGKKIPNLKGQKIFYPGEQKFLRTKTNSKKSIKIPKNIKKDLDILLDN